MEPLIKTAEEIKAMRYGGRILAEILQQLKAAVKPGISSQRLAELTEAGLRRRGAESAFLGYQEFPAVLCVSLNHEVVHGLPAPERLVKDGDVVSLDIGVKYQGLITDAAISLIAGQAATSEAERLVKATEAALYKGVEKAVGGHRLGDVSQAVQAHLEANGLGVVRDLVGHGVGRQLHEPPNLPNFGQANTGLVLKPGMTLAIEPMATLGDYRIKVAADGWTAETADRSLAAHFEHTILVTNGPAEILTKL